MIKIEDLFDGNIVKLDGKYYEVQIKQGNKDTDWMPIINLIGKPVIENINIVFEVVK